MTEPQHHSPEDRQAPAWPQEARGEPPRADPFAGLTERDKRLMEFYDPTEVSASNAPPRSRPAGLFRRLGNISRGLLAIFRDPEFSPIEPRPREPASHRTAEAAAAEFLPGSTSTHD
jgi:hypothetical protein